MSTTVSVLIAEDDEGPMEMPQETPLERPAHVR